MVTRQLQVSRRTEKVRRPKTDVLPLSHAANLTPSDAWFLGLTRVTHPNGIAIGSAVSAGIMNATNRQKHRQTDHATPSVVIGRIWLLLQCRLIMYSYISEVLWLCHASKVIILLQYIITIFLDNYYCCFCQVENSKSGGRVAHSTLHIRWPYEVESGYPSGKNLLYLMDAPVVCRHQCYFSSSAEIIFTPAPPDSVGEGVMFLVRSIVPYVRSFVRLSLRLFVRLSVHILLPRYLTNGLNSFW